jgi:predicted nucleic acid-binding Zn ribbon protein
MKTKICPICNKEFIIKNDNKLYCSKECYYINTKLHRKSNKCSSCGKPIHKTAKRCHSCETKHNHEIGVFSNIRNRRMKGKHHTEETKKIISKKLSGVKSIHWKKAKIRNCIVCNQPIDRHSKSMCKECYRKKLINNKSHNNKGNITKLSTLIWCSYYNQEWRKKIFERDNYTCKLCGENHNIYLNAHHKIPVSSIIILYNIKNFNDAKNCPLLWDINWGITLCEKCHNKIPKSFKKRILC